MRLEPNISLREIKNGESLPGYKVEIKNINSFRFVERAIDYEIKRQKEILEEGGEIRQETRGFDERKMMTLPQRGKEEAQDYRYFPEPDIPPISWEESQIANFKSQIGELPNAKLSRFTVEYKLSEYDAGVLTTSLPLADYFEEAVRVGQEHGLTPKQLANVIINKKIDPGKLLPAQLVQILLKKTQQPQLDEEKLGNITDQVLLDNGQAVRDYKKGKGQALMFLVGQVVRQAKGQASAEIIKKLLEEKLSTLTEVKDG